jgi:hypothetical protein
MQPTRRRMLRTIAAAAALTGFTETVGNLLPSDRSIKYSLRLSNRVGILANGVEKYVSYLDGTGEKTLDAVKLGINPTDLIQARFILEVVSVDGEVLSSSPVEIKI